MPNQHSPGPRRTHKIPVGLTEPEYARVKLAADNARTSVADILRSRGVPGGPDPQEESKRPVERKPERYTLYDSEPSGPSDGPFTRVDIHGKGKK